ncbi:sensor histidine kinase [Pedobacter alpinus]|uniref:histidine kinase n=1 Tax=Pedobacter alpinus TaxID=1590643 RepID=A0ABW5TT32_9SPHI
MKLLTYSSQKYLWLSSLLIISSIPLFYFVVNSIFLNATDRFLENQAYLTPNHINEIKSADDLEIWRKLDKDLEITLYNPQKFNPKPYTAQEINPKSNKLEDYRHLQKQLQILGIQHIITYKTSLLEKEDLIKSILMVQIGLLLLIFASFLIINRTISKKIWLPFNKILSFLKNYELNKENNPITEKLDIDELNDLNIDIQNLLNRTETTYRLQKEFTENAAHELQTPVAIIKSKLDLLLQEKNLSNSQSILIDQIYYVLQKLSDLNKNLLFLSKLENQQFDFKDDIDTLKTTANAIENLNFFAEAKYQQLLFPKPESSVLKGNQPLFDQLLQNLLINAVQYSPKGSIIHINLSKDSLIFINEGAALDFEEEKLFSRFSKTIEKEQKGNGLGLAISKKIANVHGFDLSYEYTNSKHHFIIKFNKPSQT